MKYGIAKSTLPTIMKHREKLIELEKQQKVNINRLRFKEAKYPHLEHRLILWLKSAINSNIAASGKIIKAQKTIFAKNMNITNFKFSNGWFENYKTKNELVYKVIRSDSEEVELEVCEN